MFGLRVSCKIGRSRLFLSGKNSLMELLVPAELPKSDLFQAVKASNLFGIKVEARLNGIGGGLCYSADRDSLWRIINCITTSQHHT